MIISLDNIERDYKIPLKGVIHIGAHYGQEYKDYASLGISDMIFFEPVQSNYDGLIKSLPANERIKTFKLALGNETGKRKIYIEKANQGMSSSMLEAGTHLIQYPWITFNDSEIVDIDKLDNIEFDRSLYNILNVDVQGFELDVFKGSVETLKSIDIIYTEVNAEEVYKGCALVGELTDFLSLQGFTKIVDNISNNGRWGDALYLRC